MTTTTSSVLLYVTVDGEIGYVLPMADRAHRTLRYATNKLLTQDVPQAAGLHPIVARRLHPHLFPDSALLDGALLAAVVGRMGRRERRAVGTRLGKSEADILAAVHAIAVDTTTFF